MNFKIEYLTPDKLKVNPSNPRLIKDTAFKSLVKSLEECPSLFDARPCICSDRTGDLVILAGNMRFLAAKELKYKKIPVIVMHGLTEAQEKEILIKDNGTTWGEWNFDLLANEFCDFPLKDWGVDLPEDWLKPPDPDASEDDFDSVAAAEAIKCPVTKPGEIWMLGKHRIMCGDSTKAEDVDKLRGGSPDVDDN